MVQAAVSQRTKNLIEFELDMPCSGNRRRKTNPYYIFLL